MIDTNAILRTYLASGGGATAALVALVGTRIYCPRLPENCIWPAGQGALGFFTRGGTVNPHIPDLPSPSVQFDCWASTPIVARQVYRALYDAFQIQEVAVGANRIACAIEEVQGQDLEDADIPKYFRVIAFFQITLS